MPGFLEPHEPLWEESRRVLGEIAAALPRAAVRNDPSLGSGLTGMALFQAYLHRELPDAPGAEWVERWISEAVELLGEAPRPPALFGGYTGIAWAVQHLRQTLGIPEDEDPGSDIDEALLALVSQGPWRGHYELVEGLVGFGVHACERLDWPLGPPLLEQVVRRLEELAVERDGGITWHTPPHLLLEWQRALHPNGYYNLGLAHGMPGVLLLLSQACAHGIATSQARPMLDGGLRWLRAQRRPEDGGARFEMVLPAASSRPQGPGRVSWCYGDLGLSVALLQAAHVAGDAEGEQEALHAARRAAARPLEQTDVMDAGLCHGAAGNAHLFHRLYQATGEPPFREAARAWLSRALELRRPGEGIAGFRAWVTDSQGSRWQDEPGLLIGAAGIGLVLLAATGTVAPDWDRVFMASTRPVRASVRAGDTRPPGA